MKTCKKLFQPHVIFSILFFFLALPAVWAGSSGTVLSLKGEAFIKESPAGADWSPLVRGAQAPDGSMVKTGAGAAVRMLKPDGTMMQIPADTEITLNFSGQKGPEEGGVSTFVSEFFSPNARTRINAVRTEVGPLQQDWIALSESARISPDRIEAALQLSAEFQQINIPNRSVFILWKLSDLFPDNDGLKAVAAQAVQTYQFPGQWEARVVSQEVESPLTPGTPLKKGDVVSLTYRSSHEGYGYVFQTTVTANGFSTKRFFPDAEDVMAVADQAFFASRIAPEEMYLEVEEDGVQLQKDSSPLSEAAGELKKGQTVEVLERKGRRYRVRVDNQEGWVLGTKLASRGGDPFETVFGQEIVRRYGGTSLGKKPGETIVSLPVDGTWSTVYLWGWVSAGPLPKSTIDQIVSQAEGLLKKQKEMDEKALAGLLPGICGSVQTLRLEKQ